MPTGTTDPLLNYEALNAGVDSGQDTEPNPAAKANDIRKMGENIGIYRGLAFDTYFDDSDSDTRIAA